MNRKSVLLMVGFAGLSLLTAGGREGPDSGRDGVSAGDTIPVSNDMAPVFGTDDRKAGAKKGEVSPEAKKGRSPESVTQEAGRGMLTEFQRAQITELRALEHRNTLELRELKASQKTRSREWDRHEKESRHKFFEEHRNGPDRRAYVQNFIARHRDFDQSLRDELKQKQQEQETRARSLKSEHAARLKEFKAALERGERPAAGLWPGASGG